jgi:RimJ/RimL family protein N-acetyltransferase
MPLALRTPRLLLRVWRDEDLDPFAEMCADPEVMRYYPPKPDRAASDAWVARMRTHNEAHGFAYWAVELPGIGLIGALGLSRTRFPPVAPAVEIGWRLASAHWGRGYATEAARAVLDDGFGRLGIDEIVAFTVPANRRSWRVMQRLGMHRDPAADFEHPGLPQGHPLRQHILYRLRRRQP